MCTLMLSSSSVKVFIFLLLHTVVFGDISHLLAPDYAIYQQYPYQIAFQKQLHPTLPSFYGPPPHAYPDTALHSHPPSSPISTTTHSPVAPTQSTTESFVPEINENRSVKDRFNFIPLQSQYLPPDERPIYESPPKPGAGYYYSRPTVPSTTTTERSSPIVVVEPAAVDPFPPPPSSSFQGYDYNVPSARPPPATALSTPSPAPAYLPPPPIALIASNSLGFNDVAVVEHLDASNPLRLRVKDMRCLQQQQHSSGYFRASLKVDSFIAAVPTVDNDSIDKRCELKLSRSNVLIDIASDDFNRCGVYVCGKDLCLRLRFPAIRSMRTGDDAILTLHCKGQERIATKTHALKVGVANDVQARSIGTYAHGGVQNPLRTQIELLRRSKNGFTRHLESNGAVQLGEDLILRAHVIPGDGWNYTKLTDINLQRISAAGELLNSANLITSKGCVNPSMQSICSHPPSYDPPLGYKLLFKAVMFQGMHSGEELMMSMRITACLEEHDCYTIGQEQCSGGGGGGGGGGGDFGHFVAGVGRQKRDITAHEMQSNKQTEVSEISRISFRVIMDEIEVSRREDKPRSDQMAAITIEPRALILATSLGFVALLTCLGAIVAWKMNQ